MSVSQLLGAAGAEYFINGNTYSAASNGLITGGSNSAGSFVGIKANDLVGLLNAGCTYAVQRGSYTNFGIVKAASAAVLVASTSLVVGGLTIASQPDVPRQAAFVINPGASAITAGSLAVAYDSTDGVSVSDNLSLATGANTAATLVTTRGVSRLLSATVAGLTGGTTPNIQGGTNNVLALPADVGQAGLTVTMATVDSAPDTSLPTQSATDGHLITPYTAPNNTHVYGFGYNFISP